ncbi:hypothetical protein [Dactylosporangium darangshiense]|uniref:Uncharacterized protein n=1 Tax=Dactylosporangium darangshiense TaxID=579108 RepID=A0ABP8D7G5_9ACTN
MAPALEHRTGSATLTVTGPGGAPLAGFHGDYEVTVDGRTTPLRIER